MTVFDRALNLLAEALRAHRNQRATRWRKLTAGRQALLVVAYLRKGETYTDLACGFQIGTSTVYRYVREALALLAAMAPTLEHAIEVARGKAFVILDGTLLRIDRVGMASGRDRAFDSGKHTAHGLNVQAIADPIGGLVWISPPPPGVRHDMGAARDHGVIDAITDAEIPTVADTAHQGAGLAVAVPRAGVTSARTPAATGACRATRKTSTPRRPPPRAGRAGQRRAEELEDPAQDPI
jgi:hypothetical protein